MPSDNTQHVQETHIALGHIIAELVERALFERPLTTSRLKAVDARTSARGRARRQQRPAIVDFVRGLTRRVACSSHLRFEVFDNREYVVYGGMTDHRQAKSQWSVPIRLLTTRGCSRAVLGHCYGGTEESITYGDSRSQARGHTCVAQGRG